MNRGRYTKTFYSKPGAAAVAAWVSYEVIGLHNEGYGALFGEAVFSCEGAIDASGSI